MSDTAAEGLTERSRGIRFGREDVALEFSSSSFSILDPMISTFFLNVAVSSLVSLRIFFCSANKERIPSNFWWIANP